MACRSALPSFLLAMLVVWVGWKLGGWMLPCAAIDRLSARRRFRGWVGQRTHDFWTVRSEAIRVAKRSLEAAGMDMLAPIFRVQLSEPLAATHTAPTRPTTPSRSPQAQRSKRATPPALDMGVNRELEQQIDQGREAQDQPNLLDAQAPRE